MLPIIIKEHNPSIHIPIFDDNLKYYFENKGYGIWVFDTVTSKVIWGNEAALQVWGIDKMENFIDFDLTMGNEAAREAGRMMAMDSLHQKDSYHPWMIPRANGEPPYDCVLRVSGLDLNGHLVSLGEVQPALQEVRNKATTEKELKSNIALAQETHEAFKFAPSMMTLVRMDGKVLYQNITAQLYYRKVIKEYSNTIELDDTNVVGTVLGGRDGQSLDYETLIAKVSNNMRFEEQILVPPFSASSETWHSVSATKIRSTESGEFLIVVNQLDISESKRKDLKIALMKAAQKQQEKDKLVQAAGQELRAPILNVIGLSDEILQHAMLNVSKFENEDVTQIRLWLNSINQSGEYLEKVLNKLLEYSTMQHQLLTFNYTLVDMKHIIQTVTGQFPRSSTIRLELDLPETMPCIPADEKSMQTIIEIIYGNALQFTKYGVIKVTLHNRIQGTIGCIVISIQDSGIGIPESLQDEIFEPFAQSDSNLNHVGGLGLSLAKQIITKHGGSVFLQSELNQGSTFTFSIPNRPEAISISDTQN